MLQPTSRKTFNPGTVNEKPALCGVDLDLAAGDFATIVGSNGAGKSTLFNAIAGSFMVDSGRIGLDGKDITYLAGAQAQPEYRPPVSGSRCAAPPRT